MAYEFDPELAVIVPQLPSTTLDDIDAARAWIAGFAASAPVPDETGLDITNREVPGYQGDPDVAVRMFRPSGVEGALPAIVHIHGGGFVLGNVDGEHASSILLSRELQAVVVSVEYRLAPEHPYPAGLHDCYAALTWLADNADVLGVDTDRIVVYGQSAGGGLAAGLALFARDRGGPRIKFQFLGIPEIDDRLETASMKAFVDTPMWNRPNVVMSWRYYLGDPAPTEIPIYAAPARAADLAGLPPAYVSTMEFDPLRDEGILYATRMLAAGVKVELHSYPGTFHGSSVVPHAEVSKRMAAEQLDVLRRAVSHRH